MAGLSKNKLFTQARWVRMLKQTFPALVLALALGMLIACSSGQDREKVAQQRFQSLPQLSNSVLVTTVSGISGGTSEKCYGGYVEALYGTDKLQSDIISLYRQYIHDNQWIEKSYDAAQLISVQQDGDYYLGISILTLRKSPTELYPSRIHPRVIDAALNQFNTVYLVEVSYYPNRTNC